MNFDTANKIRELAQTVTRLCKFCENGVNPSELTGCQTILRSTSNMLQTCKTELQQKTTTSNVAELNEHLKNQLKTQQGSHEQVISHMNNVISELKTLNEILKTTNNELQLENRSLRVEITKVTQQKDFLEKQKRLRVANCEQSVTDI